jgi:hypothetical protein
MNKDQVTGLQKDMNGFTDKFLENVAPIMVDGVRGPATNKRIIQCKFFLGYTGPPQHSTRLSPPFRRRLNRPKSAKIMPAAMLKRGEERRKEQREQPEPSLSSGVTTFDGRAVAAWLKPYLDFARKNGWRGTLNSGFRDPARSEALCFQMCGAPSCPGRCAGRASNHAGSTKPKGAVDVSDFARFGQLMERCPHEPRIFNALGAQDPVHFSATGRDMPEGGC